MMEAQQLRPTLVTFAALVEAGVTHISWNTRNYVVQACGHGLFWDRALALLEVWILVQMQR